MAADQEQLLSYYQAELSYLRRMGANFAEMYPKVASRLELGPDGSSDPHVERLIEAFAFLTGRIQNNIDEQFPEITTALLDVLYPQLLNPIPSMSVARIDADAQQGNLTTGYRIPAQTPLFADTRDGATCRFRTCYPVTLWPVEVVSAGFESTDRFDFLDERRGVASVLRLQLQCATGDFSELSLDTLRFYINGELRNASGLYEMLFAHCSGLAVLPQGAARPALLPAADALRAVGFASDEEVLPYPAHAHPGYRLVQEYFAFPRKFLFFDVAHLRGHLTSPTVDLIFMLDEAADARLGVDRSTFALGCTPIVNLFRKTSEPIRLDHRQLEYRLMPDMRRERTTEVHSIRSVSTSMDDENLTRVVKAFYSFDHDTDGGAQAYWHARRVPTGRKDMPGTEMMLSFLDLDFNPRTPAVQIAFAHTLCTNRRLAEQLPAGALLQTEFPAPIARISALHKPTAQIQPPIGGAAQWRLISHLSLNYLSLLDDRAGLRGLREILRLYGRIDDAATQTQISGIVSMSCRPVVRRIGPDAWRGFCRGTEVTLVFDESGFVGTNAFVFASVMHHFLALYSSVNSFTQLVARSTRREGIWKRWPALSGEQPLL